ncbi:MAG TPA: PEP-CTERM sorting domain-containing protein [Chthoniobacteraceae bacterium]|nr:PEP-CTERM sorting domain-containing protein [Chthoniobacteraceae bacterium]
MDLFELTLLGDSRFSPAVPGDGGESLGSPALIDTDNGSGVSTWATGADGEPANNAAGDPSLGTFNVATGDTLTLDGGEELTYKNGDSNVSAATMFYSINGGSYSSAPLAFNEDDVNSSAGDQRWYSDTSADANLLAGLPNGTYTLSVYFQDTNTDDGNDYISNNSGNYNATFTVVPEPATLGMLLCSGLFGSFYLIRRRRM